MRYGFDPLNVVDNHFYFGIGGMGDFLLLMSTFYDDIVDDSPDVIFVCNNVKAIRELSKKFDKVNRFWFFPRRAFSANEPTWSDIYNHDLCKGTGVTPAGFRYVEEWINVGTSIPHRGCFHYYGVRETPKFASPIETDERYIVIQPNGGADDPTKVKEIPTDDLENIIVTWDGDIKIIGSPEENRHTSKRLGEIFTDNQIVGLDIEWVTDIGRAFDLIRGCQKFYGADSWGKTVACFAKKFPTVYPNQYAEGRGPMQLFNHPTDPGDYIFLEGWMLDVEGTEW